MTCYWGLISKPNKFFLFFTCSNIDSIYSVEVICDFLGMRKYSSKMCNFLVMIVWVQPGTLFIVFTKKCYMFKSLNCSQKTVVWLPENVIRHFLIFTINHAIFRLFHRDNSQFHSQFVRKQLKMPLRLGT